METFQTISEIDTYLSGNRIQCLVCGKQFRRLQYKHLLMHGLSADDYRLQFGIPWGRSLTSAPSRQLSVRAMTPERIEVFKQCISNRAGRRPRRLSPPAVRNVWKKSAETGRYFARALVTVGCVKCGAPVETTALCATQPIHCESCASPQSLRLRVIWRNKKKEQIQHLLSRDC
jgi:hypothetical protein